MERYTKKFEEQVITKKLENGDEITYLEGREGYHIHKSDMEKGDFYIEMDIFGKILEYLNIDEGSITQEQTLLCLEEIARPINELGLELIKLKEEE
jgi:hypothetical protein